MIITFAGIQLSDLAFAQPFNCKMNGTNVKDAVQIIRATRQAVFDRGNSLSVFTFSVKRTFTTVVDAEVYFLTQHNQLPTFGTASMVCGLPNETQQTVTMVNAHLDASVASNNGTTVVVNYTITAPGADTDTPVGFINNTSNLMIQGSTVQLTAGQTTLTVNYPVSYAAGTKVVFRCEIQVPTGAAAIGCTVIADQTGVNSGAARFDVPIPGSPAGSATSYQAAWTAIG